jgi:hypothetical protein
VRSVQDQSNGGLLPPGFEALEPLVAHWALESEHDRRERRASSQMQELQDYYTRVGPRITDIARHLDDFPADRSLPAAQHRLFRLGQMYMEVAWAVEFLNAPEESDQVPRSRWMITRVGGAEGSLR